MALYIFKAILDRNAGYSVEVSAGQRKYAPNSDPSFPAIAKMTGTVEFNPTEVRDGFKPKMQRNLLNHFFICCLPIV
jgi:hypothetical protein